MLYYMQVVQHIMAIFSYINQMRASPKANGLIVQ